MKHYDVIVIGGGPSGLMAAIAAGEQGADVLLIDKGNKLGRKLAISGGGRCNVTNRLPVEEIIKHIPGNGRFLYSAFSEFNNEDIIVFFEKLGIQLKEEDHGRMFPVTDKAQSVVDALLNRLNELSVTIRTNEKIKEVRYEDGRTAGITTNNGELINANAVIIAVGGKSVPHTGSTGDGYAWAEAAGHTITELFPTEVPVTSAEPFIKKKTLQGLSLRNTAVSVLNKKGKPIVTHVMDMLFTHFGLSGPAILRCSQFVVKELKKQPEVKLRIDLFPDINEEELFQRMYKELKETPKRALKNALKPWMQERYLLFLLERNGLDPQMCFTDLPKDPFRAFVKDCKQFTVSANGTLSLDKAFVTGGGVSVKEIEPKKMASKKMEGLYFCGEILDIHGYTGGYNITSALVTGRLAGLNAGLFSRSL
ncbi:NAD(P)/FAD-dependent oxidoreductase [Bacillus sp. ISL-51]|uniref:NAD(P)/FAD-dependent oxidoreductase n=1 Tax=unclassified Bacillus (in: firmicutes) TaxID=185979 RepID=UPI001BE6FD12|nr:MULTISPECIES: NAD(P)/FAD-dependent oxidoreductase [unclassified Bacillus (in: firmicutes)]MBT2574037.1 NAD(P)/FAD-dependent oxidoreductase [Bacillus sp. ISL-51]MBT2636300.1 NAD(P)/FAD-dependent oxidoreductase [Bacillus sp. ISL-26]